MRVNVVASMLSVAKDANGVRETEERASLVATEADLGVLSGASADSGVEVDTGSGTTVSTTTDEDSGMKVATGVALTVAKSKELDTSWMMD
jgi:hypothetical protein